MRRTAAIVLMLLAIACASGAAPRAVIRDSGPGVYGVGDMVVLNALEAKYDEGGVKWLLVGSDKTFFQFGPHVVFSSSADGKFHFVLVCVGAVDGKPLADIASHTVVIGASPPPGPEPGPNPPPGPGPGPLDLTGISKDVYAWASDVPAASRSISGELGQNFADVAAAVSAGVIKDPAAIVKETHTRNLATQGDKRSAWQPFFQQLMARLNSLAKSGELKTTDQHAVLWREIAVGLKAVK